MNEYVIAKYIRLSQDDAVSESLSIPNQRLLLNRHIDELDMPNATILEFVDNGYTGTNLERPAIQEMLELMRCGRINCIIAKDFSRFSRNAMESGYYIERVFPLYRVRFIAIGDFFDSSDHLDGTGGIDVAFRFLMHEYYSKDLSMKVKSAKRVLMERGEHIVGGAIYGYRKNDSGKWEPDPEPAEIVRQIFSMALEGLSTSQIRDRLFTARVPAPREYEYMQRGKEFEPRYIWPTRSVFRVLTNEQYTGTYIAGKIESTRIGNKSRVEHDRSDWIIIPNSHPAIVNKEDFAAVQEMLKNPKERAPQKPTPSSHSAASRTKIASGERKSSAVPYGYIRDDNRDWAVDPIAAKVVCEIFDMRLQGLTAKEICGKLQEAGYPTPLEYFKLSRGNDIEPTNRWPGLRVSEILKDEQYTGAYVAGKSFQDANGKKYRPPQSEWIIIPGKHPPIISKEVFDKVQALRVNGKRIMSQRDYLLRGKVSCGCCGFALIYSDSIFPATYRCMKTHADPTAACHKMKASADEVDNAVMAIIRKQAEVILGSGDLPGLRKINGTERSVGECEKQIRQWVERRQIYYEQFVQGEIDREAHMSLKGECAEQLDRLNTHLAFLKQTERDRQANQKAVDMANKVLDESISKRDIVDALIDKILVFPGNHLEIKWKFLNFAAHA